MSSPVAEPEEADFIEAIELWTNALYSPAGKSWRNHWLMPKCTVLAYARRVECSFNDNAAQALAKLAAADHDSCAKALFKNGKGDPDEPAAAAAAARMRSLIASIQAAARIANWDNVGEPDNPPTIVHDSVNAAAVSLTNAWPLLETTASKSGPAGLGYAIGRVDVALNKAIEQQVMNVSTYCALRLLLVYLLKEPEDSVVGDDVESSMLLKAPSGGGFVRGLKIHRLAIPQRGYFVDPVATGLTVFDESMLATIKLAWQLCSRPPLLKGGEDVVLQLAPAVEKLELLEGASAGGLMACAMYAAVKGERLSTLASASVSLLKPSDWRGTEPWDKVPVYPVDEDSLEPKLRAAAEAKLGRVVLHSSQVEQGREIASRLEPSLHILPAETLPDVVDILMGDAKMERVLYRYSKRIVEKWNDDWDDDDRSDLERDYLPPYIEPGYSWLQRPNADRMENSENADLAHDTRSELSANDRPIDIETGGAWLERLSEHGSKKKSRPGRTWERVAATSSTEVELRQLLAASRFLCVVGDPYEGKSVLARRVEWYLSTAEGHRALGGGRPLLACVIERNWPKTVEEVVKTLATRIERARESNDETSAQVARWAWENDRVVLILDGLDQANIDEIKSRIDLLETLLGHSSDDKAGRPSNRVIVTSRWSAVNHFRDTRGSAHRWRFAQINPFSIREQYEYLVDRVIPQATPSRHDVHSEWEQLASLKAVFRDYVGMSALLSSPGVLKLIRQLLALLPPAKSMPVFYSRTELYWKLSKELLLNAARRMATYQSNVQRPPDQAYRWRQLLAAIAFEMMVREQYDYTVEGDDPMADLMEKVSLRFPPHLKPTNADWVSLDALSAFTCRELPNPFSPGAFGFKHRGLMEYYAGVHMALNQQDNWVYQSEENGLEEVRCGDPDVYCFANEHEWFWAFRSAIELAPILTEPNHKARLLATVAELYEPRVESTSSRSVKRKPGRRPTELMYLGWHLIDTEGDALLLRQLGHVDNWGRPLTGEALRDAASRLAIPGAEAVLARFRSQLWDLVLDGNAVARSLVPGPMLVHEKLIEECELPPTRRGHHHYVRCPNEGPDLRFTCGASEEDEFFINSIHPQDFEDDRSVGAPRNALVREPFWMQAYPASWGQFALFDQTACEVLVEFTLRERTYYYREHERPEVFVNTPLDSGYFLQEVSEYSRKTVFISKVGMNSPVMGITWYDAFCFAKWTRGRLPTEAEWEYACRAGLGNDAIPWVVEEFECPGKEDFDFLGEKIHYIECDAITLEEEYSGANPWGLYWMHDGVLEWCWDSSGTNRKSNAEHDAVLDLGGVPHSGDRRVCRGGQFWRYGAVEHPAVRHSLPPSYGVVGGVNTALREPSSHLTGVRVVSCWRNEDGYDPAQLLLFE